MGGNVSNFWLKNQKTSDMQFTFDHKVIIEDARLEEIIDEESENSSDERLPLVPEVEMKNMLPDYSSDTDYDMLTKETASYALKTRTTTTTTTTSLYTTTSNTSSTTPVSKTTRTKVTPF